MSALLLTLTAGAPVTAAEVAAMLRCEYRLAFHPPAHVADPTAGTPVYTTLLAEARALVAHWTGTVAASSGTERRALVGARIVVTCRALAYPRTATMTVLDVTLVRRRPFEQAWEPTAPGPSRCGSGAVDAPRKAGRR